MSKPAKAILLVVGLALLLAIIGLLGWQSTWYSDDPGHAAASSLLEGKLVVIDPGHLGYSVGTIGAKGLTEAEVNLQVGLYLKEYLQAAGARVLLTVEHCNGSESTSSSSLSIREDLNKRVRVASNSRADLFVSIHHNATSSRMWIRNIWVNRTEVYYWHGSDEIAARKVMHRLSKKTKLKGRVQRKSLHVIRYTQTPSILIEASYLSNPLQERILRSPEKLRLEAEGIYLGIVDILG